MIMQLQAPLQLEQLQGLLCRLRLIAAGSSINGYHQLIPHPASLLIPQKYFREIREEPRTTPNFVIQVEY
jgi:hypothetical protein